MATTSKDRVFFNSIQNHPRYYCFTKFCKNLSPPSKPIRCKTIRALFPLSDHELLLQHLPLFSGFGFYSNKPKNALRTKTIHCRQPRSSILPFIHHVINNWQFFKCFFNISCQNWRFYSVEFQLSLKKLYKAVTTSICFNWQHFSVIKYTQFVSITNMYERHKIIIIT